MKTNKAEPNLNIFFAVIRNIVVAELSQQSYYNSHC